SHTAQTQFTSSHRPYQPRVPRSIQPGSKNDFTARPSSMIPYAAPRRRMLGHPVFQRTAVSRMTRTPAPYSQIRKMTAIGFSHSSGGVDPESISAMTGERRMSARRGRRFGWAVGSFTEERVVRPGHKSRGNNVAGHRVPPNPMSVRASPPSVGVFNRGSTTAGPSPNRLRKNSKDIFPLEVRAFASIDPGRTI